MIAERRGGGKKGSRPDEIESPSVYELISANFDMSGCRSSMMDVRGKISSEKRPPFALLRQLPSSLLIYSSPTSRTSLPEMTISLPLHDTPSKPASRSRIVPFFLLLLPCLALVHYSSTRPILTSNEISIHGHGHGHKGNGDETASCPREFPREKDSRSRIAEGLSSSFTNHSTSRAYPHLHRVQGGSRL